MKEIDLKKQNKILWIIISCVLIVTIATSVTLFGVYYFNYGTDPVVEEKAQNFILLIGDGMGINHIKTAELYNNGSLLNMRKLPVTGEVMTRSLSAGATDSAASATTYATGEKTYNGRLSFKDGKNLTTIAEEAMANGKKVGIVATKVATDATPAAFLAHSNSRHNTAEIASQIVASDVDVLFGLNNDELKALASSIQTDNRDYCTSFEEISASTSEKIFGLFDEDIPNIGRNTLASLTDTALAKLENENGFFLMVEGSKIDSYSHTNEMDKMIDELNGFDAAVSRAVAWARKNGNTTVLVLADHETGNLKIPAEATADQISNDWFHSTGHTSQNIHYFGYGIGVNSIPALIDNTDVYDIIKQLLF
ncbi:MAG: alkaline phosphatase [Clostridia bacterium]|nr:alkaline phosphatase [Clostridia bacterium]